MEVKVTSAPLSTRRSVTPPLIVIEAANPSAEAHFQRAIEAARVAGWQPVAGWIAGRGRVACHGVVASDADAVLALRAAVEGSAVTVLATSPRETIDRLIDDLRRLGAVRHLTVDVPPPMAFHDEQRSLLRLLAEGMTLGEAAAELGLSRLRGLLGGCGAIER